MAALVLATASCGSGASKPRIENELGFDPEGIIARQIKSRTSSGTA